MENYLLLVAGGTGSRMGTEVPKQFLDINGKPVIYYAIQQFLKADSNIRVVIVIHPVWKSELNDVLKKYFPEHTFIIAEGGETRFHSVKNGLSVINEEGVVCIHDAARPLVSTETITRCIEAVKTHGSAVPVIRINESLRKTENNATVPVNRDDFRVVQTPQCFKIAQLKAAFEINYQPSFTDDATVFEKAGNSIHLVEGNPENIKITLPSDLLYAELFLR